MAEAIKKHVLVCDDDLDTVEILRIKLENAGFGVIVARDGQECLEKFQQATPGLLIVDVMMPKFSGFKVVRLLKSDKRFAGIPMVILTARTQEADKQMSVSVEADAYITKPFNLDALLETVKKLIK